jgi:guanylate kinase
VNNPIIIVSGPSGAGKTELVKRLLAAFKPLVRIITCTTRVPRPGEENGKDYHFLSEAEFEAGIEAKAFTEYSEVHGYYYGTRANDVSLAKNAGPCIIVLDPQGVEKFIRAFPEARCAFIMAPEEQLRARIMSRCPSQSDLNKRMADIRDEMLDVNKPYFTCIINNIDGDFERSFRLLFEFVHEQL